MTRAGLSRARLHGDKNMWGATMYARARCTGLVAFLLLLFAVDYSFADPLRWEIERNFRYFRYNSDVAVQRVAFDLFVAERSKQPDPAELEKFLNGTEFWLKKLSVAGTARDAWPAAWRKPGLDTPLELIGELRKSEGSRGPVPSRRELERLGWASLLVQPQNPGGRDGQTDTCWSPVRRMHSNCAVYGDYARPRGWIVRVFDPGAAMDAKCSWRADGGADANDISEASVHATKGPHSKVGPWQSPANRSCREARVYVPSDIRDAHKVKGAVKIWRRAADGTETPPIEVTPQDTLIVGFADSFGSGEGNPERGAQFLETPIQNISLPGRRSDAEYPQERAQWTDRWCHRSVYSWQIRTALHLSQTNHQKSVTVLPYGCSGAEVFEGILYPYYGVEETKPTKAIVGHPAQLGLAYQELCKTFYKAGNGPQFPKQPRWQTDEAVRTAAENGEAIDFTDARKNAILNYIRNNVTRCERTGPGQFQFKRDVDYLLLVSGINDIGFSKWVAAAISDKEIADIAHGFIPKDGHPETELRLQRLKFRYAVFREALDKRFLVDAGLLSDAAAGVLPRVLTPLYPRGLEDQNGAICDNGNQGMTGATYPGGSEANNCKRSGSFGSVRGPVLAIQKTEHMIAIETFRAKALNGGVTRFSAPSSSGVGYTVISSPTAETGAFANRGFCATQDLHSAIPAGVKCIDFASFEHAPPPACDADSDACVQKAAESLHIARGAWGLEWPGQWRPFPAAGNAPVFNFHPYAHRTRLLRTPNDVYMLVNQRPSNVLDTTKPGILDVNGRMTGGAFHPTAEGHAIMGTLMMKYLTLP